MHGDGVGSVDEVIPRIWSSLDKSIVAECDISPSRGATLRAKLLVFRSSRCLRHFWQKTLGRGDLGEGCLGAVNSLSTEHIKFDKGGKETRYMEFDPRYFCIIGLCREGLSMEIICHESVHAALCLVRRRRVDPMKDMAGEERLAYPCGAIAAEINRFLHRRGLYLDAAS